MSAFAEARSRHFWRQLHAAAVQIAPLDRPGRFESKDQTDPKHAVLHPDELAKWNYELGDYFEIGTVFTVIAGLLNILAIFERTAGRS